MVLWFKCLFGSCGLVLLSLYCQGTLAVQATVDAPGAVPPTIPGPIPTGAPIDQKQVLVGSMAGIGRMFVMVALVWLVIDVMRKLGGGKPKFTKPLIVGGVGIVIAYLLPAIIK
jgi:hypothetical protein